ncbi:Mu transposase C-terminal domain-containing protein [Metabacillus arenae]|uniref:DDE-type integrase/transposase/recombinase n=1 Tax=Metabacillus arenae TaxID=2771434 RepID=A0A926S2Y8_9BACI|nr:Mu transposase C-terminal domain-containing protein [Metabacillus arenae]MBD1382444.1 DDE-type integrase/transposase/recombinase [Metabacillus arenae]
MILVNRVYQYVEDNKRIRIIEIVDPMTFYVDIDAVSSMPSEILLSSIESELEQEKLLLISDPFAKAIEDKDLTEVQILKRDEGLQVIEQYCLPIMDTLLKKRGRENTLSKIAKMSGVSKTKVKRLLSRYWQRGMNKNALLPDYFKSGGHGQTRKLDENKVGRPRNINSNGENQYGINITNEIKIQFEHVINKYYRSTNQYSLKDVYNFLLRDFYSHRYKENGTLKYKIWDSNRVPTYHQFYYWFKKFEDPKKDIQFRKSAKEYELKYRPLISNSKMETNGPGTRFQIDATIADIYLASAIDRSKVIGRPVIYAVIDVYSRLLTGIYIGLEGPSWLGAMMALDNMVSDKVEFCKQYQIDITEEQWPSHHIPEIIIADRGEFEGYAVENLINNLNIKIENTSAYRGDLKGIVERKFRTINGKIKKKAPGAIQKEFRERGDMDYRLHATLNLKEFTQIIIQMVLYHNLKIIEKYPMEKEMIADELVPSPINLWNWGVQNRKGRPRTIERKIFRLNVLPKGKATISRAGIKFKNLLYGSDKALEEQWYLKLKNKSINIVYDPRNIEKIYIPHDDGMDYDICVMLGPSQQYKENFLEDILFQQQLQRELEELEKTNQIQLSVNVDTAIEEIIKRAEKDKKQTESEPKSKAERLRSIRENKNVEKRMNRKEEQFDLSPNAASQVAEIIDFSTKQKVDEPITKSNNARLMEKLRKKRDEEFEKE